MNRKMAVYIALGISAAAFLVDKLFLSSPKEADAQTSRGVQPARPEVRIPGPGKKKLITEKADRSLPYLNALPQTPESKRNLLAPTPAMLAHYQQKQQAEQEAREQKTAAVSAGPEAFRSAHRLQATFISDGTRLAMIDQRLVRAGDTLDGFKVMEITADSVVLQQHRSKLTLSLSHPAASAKP